MATEKHSRNAPCPCGRGKKFKNCCYRVGSMPVNQHQLPVVGSLYELTQLSNEELGRFDIAEINLACANGLPGSEQLDRAACLDKLDTLADRVRRYTEWSIEDFARKPGEFENSEAYFRILAMVTVLQKGGGVKYHPERTFNPDFTDSRDLFIHGILFGEGGTCPSLPILYIAIGRRLGYPMKLVQTKGHIFARWDELGERFNIECTSRGLLTYPDGYYEENPRPIGEEGRRAGCYLTSLTPRHELAIMLFTRGHCLEDNRRVDEATESYVQGVRLFPCDIGGQYFLNHIRQSGTVLFAGL